MPANTIKINELSPAKTGPVSLGFVFTHLVANPNGSLEVYGTPADGTGEVRIYVDTEAASELDITPGR